MSTPGSRTKVFAIGLSLLVAAAVPATADIVSNTHYYSNQTLYGDPESTSIKAPPPGYKLVLLQTLGRHGSRSATSDNGEVRALKVWSAANKKRALTTLGKRFDNDMATLRAAENKLGYGRLSDLGREQWQGIGRRTADNYAEFWADAMASGDDVKFTTSPVLRTKQSSDSLRAGLGDAAPGLDLKTRSVDTKLLIANKASRVGTAAIAKIERRSDIRAAARRILRTLYSSSYVNGLSDPVGKAMDIYNVYAIAPSMALETAVTFNGYVSARDASFMAVVKDAGNFYRYGPGVKGQTNTYSKAAPILAQFFREIDARLAGGHTAATFRLGHGETTMPFAALIRLTGSYRQASAKTPYSYGNNPWRGWVAGRMAGNIEWALYENAAGDSLVTMRYNEQPVMFNSSCTPSATGRYFYRVTALKRCLG